jgi:gliding motility-associated lipoprotein GldH
MKLKVFTTIVAAFAFLCSCTETNGVYERMAFFPKHEWSSQQKESFDFEVTDTAASYRLYFVIRHTDAYNWNNIWVNIEIKAPDTSYIIKRPFDLADNKKWFGTVVDDIVDQRIPFNENNIPVPLKKGKYTFTLQQVMREDPLLHVLNAGIRVEKAE